MLTGCTAHGRFLGRVCVLSFRTHQPQIDALVEDMAGVAFRRSYRIANMIEQSDRARLRAIAIRAMRERGLDPDFPPEALAEAARAEGGAAHHRGADARSAGRCSGARSTTTIRATSISCRWRRRSPGGDVRCWWPSPTWTRRSRRARRRSPRGDRTRRRSTRRRDRLPDAARAAVDRSDVARPDSRIACRSSIEFVVTADGRADELGRVRRDRSGITRSSRTTASAPGWPATGPLPPAAAAVPGMDAQLRMQDGVAQALEPAARTSTARWSFETLEVEHVFDGDTLRDVRAAGSRTARRR